MSEEERQAIIHLLDKQARYEYCIKNNISFSDEDYEAYIIRQSMINKDKEIKKLNNIINGMGKFFQYAYDNEVRPLNSRKVSVWTICLDKLQELKGENNE